MNKAWKKLKVSKAELQLGPTLTGGQSFRWKNVDTDSWIGVFKNKVWILLQKDDDLLYKTYDTLTSDNCTEQNENFQILSDKEIENILKSYFRLDINLNDYYRHWSEVDPYFREAAPKMYGIRILKQDIVENIFSFICSSNNNIKRISSMVEKLCELYGDDIAEVKNETFRSFPTTEKLAGNTVESDLRNAGFGYRAKFIYQTACLIKKLGGSVWLENLRSLPYQDAKKKLMKFPGIGAKVADCICLMSLGHMEAVPVDTHIFQVATKIYLPHLKKYKSLTDKVYNLIGDHFRLLHGPYAGWANTVLAKKGSSSEEDRNGYDFRLPQDWVYSRPGRGPPKFKGPKHHIFVVGRPQYQPQPFYPQAPQYSAEQQMISPFEVQQYLENVQRQMQEFSAKAYKEFQMIENEIDRNKKQLEDTMKSQFQTLELSLEAKQAKEIQQAVKDGKDELKIQECLASEEQDFRTDMNADIQRTIDCVNDGTERARKMVNDARNAYTETSIMSSMQAREWAQKIKFCAEQRNNRCVQNGVTLIDEKTKSTVQEGSQYFQKLQEAPQQQMIQLNYCRQNFMEDLGDMKEAYSKMVKRCVIASEIQEPEEDDESEEDKPEINVNVEVKPEAEAEAEAEI